MRTWLIQGVLTLVFLLAAAFAWHGIGLASKQSTGSKRHTATQQALVPWTQALPEDATHPAPQGKPVRPLLVVESLATLAYDRGDTFKRYLLSAEDLDTPTNSPWVKRDCWRLILYDADGRVSDFVELDRIWNVRGLTFLIPTPYPSLYSVAIVEHENHNVQTVYAVSQHGKLVEIAHAFSNDQNCSIGFLDVDGDRVPELVVSMADLFSSSGKGIGVLFVGDEQLPIKPVKVSVDSAQFVVLEMDFSSDRVFSWRILKCSKVERHELP